MLRSLLFATVGAVALHTVSGQHPIAEARRLVDSSVRARQPSAGDDVAVVERVLDGDTVILRGGKQRVRLANIDAPEMSHGYGKPGQPFAVQSTTWMAKKVEGKEVALRCADQDRYSRRVCVLVLDGEDVNKALVRSGLAWANTANPRYLRDRSVLDAQRDAQQARRGLWAQQRPTAPWLWRHECWEGRACSGDE